MRTEQITTKTKVIEYDNLQVRLFIAVVVEGGKDVD